MDELRTVRDAIKSIGTDWTGPTADRVLDLYANLHSRLGSLIGETRVVKDVRYGPEDRNLLDIFIPAGEPAKCCVAYFHGGGFFAGDKAWSEHVYSNIGYYLASHGILTITANYQLVPHCKYPAPADDVQLVREWVQEAMQKQENGLSSTTKLVLLGQSSGGSHIATNLYARGDAQRAAPSPDLPLAGVLYLSTPFYFDETKARRAQTLREYYGSDKVEDWKDRSPIGLLEHLPEGDASLDSGKLPTMLIVGEYDPKEIVDANVMFFDAYRARSSPKGVLPLLHVLPGHNHISNVISIGTDDDAQGRLIRDFVARVCA